LPGFLAGAEPNVSDEEITCDVAGEVLGAFAAACADDVGGGVRLQTGGLHAAARGNLDEPG
jgi:hypothetical protein